MTLTGKDIAEIARLLEASQFSELELETGGLKLRIRRGDGASRLRERSEEPEPAGTIGDQQDAPDATLPAGPTVEGEVDVEAPLLGNFYHAPRPGDEPFVKAGDTIGEETVIGIIEVMKLMNPVHAGVSGTVVAYVAANAVSVEAGQPLIRVRKAA